MELSSTQVKYLKYRERVCTVEALSEAFDEVSNPLSGIEFDLSEDRIVETLSVLVERLGGTVKKQPSVETDSDEV